MQRPLRHDPELRDVPPADLHSLRSRGRGLDSLAREVQESAARRASAELPAAEAEALRALPGAVLITGSAGYLGTALHLALRHLGVAVVGADVVASPAVESQIDISELAPLQQAAVGCAAVLHTAALHAPHAARWHVDDFIATNVRGTANVLELGLPVVHTSTTSLTITPRVKERESAGELIVLDETAQREPSSTGGGAGGGTGGGAGGGAGSGAGGGAEGDRADGGLATAPSDADPDAPRNKYGRTKLEAERLCLAAAARGQDVCMLRAPRFFVEDEIEPTAIGAHSPPLSAANLKATELLGRRCALVDLVDAELRCLARAPRLRGRLFTLAAPVPLAVVNASSHGVSAVEAAARVRTHWPEASALFASQGWELPSAITRVYDASAAFRALDMRPRVTFEAVLRAIAARQRVAEGGASGDGALPEAEPSEPLGRGVSAPLPDSAVLRGAY